MERSVAVDSYIRNDPAIKKCQPQELAHLVSVIDLANFNEEDVVYEHSDPATHIFYVVEGKIEITDSLGKTTTVRNGQYLGQESGFLAPVYVDKAVAKTKAKLLKIPAAEFAGLLDQHREVRSEILFSMFKNFDKRLSTIGDPELLSASKPAHEPKPILIVGWCLCLLVPTFTYIMAAPMMASMSGRIYLGLLTAGIIMWIFELVDSYIVGLFLVVTALVLRLAPVDVILSGYSSSTFFMALGILGLGSILVNSGVLYRLLLHILMRIPNTQLWSNVSIFTLGVTMTMAVPVAYNRVEVITPFLNEFSSQTKVPTRSNSATKLALNAIFSISLFSPIFLSGSLHNFMLLGLLWAQDQERFQWLGWLQAAAIPGLIILIGFAIPLFFILKSKEKLSIDRTKIADQLRILGPISRIEMFAVICFVIFAIGMMMQSVHRLPPQLIGLFILFSLLILEILTKENFQRLINWPALFLLGSLIGLINFFNYLELNVIIIEQMGWLGKYIKNDFNLFILMLLFIISLVRLFIPYGPAVVLLGTVFVPLAQQYEVNPWAMGFIVLLMGKMWFYPAQYPPFQDFCHMASRELAFDRKTLVIYNLYMNLVKVAAIYVSIPLWKMLGVL